MFCAAGCLVLCVLTAAPSGTSVTIGNERSPLTQTAFREQSVADQPPSDEEMPPLPPPKRLPAARAPERKLTEDEGIPGLQSPPEPPTPAQPPKAEPKAEAKVPLKPEPKAEPRPEPKPEPKAEPKPEPKVEPRPEPKPETKAAPRPEPKVETSDRAKEKAQEVPKAADEQTKPVKKEAEAAEQTPPKPLKEIPLPLKRQPSPTPTRPLGEALSTDEGLAVASDRCPPTALEPREDFGTQGRVRSWFDGVQFDGWLDQGATLNTLSPRNRSNGPVTFNNRSNDYQLNQLYGVLKRDVDRDGDTWGLGGRIDFLYGTDSFFTEARGLETFGDFSPRWNAHQLGAALPQCYAEAFCPWGSGLDMIMGHYYAPIGYESVMATNNFFYSHSYLRQYAEPFTFTGFLGTTNLGPFEIQAGMTRGWDNWEDNNNDLGFVGGIRWKSENERTEIALGVTAGREQPDASTNIRTLYSLVIQQKFGDRWQYVFQHDYGNEPGAGVDGTIAQWYGINQYLFYTINDAWKAGMRFEWFHDENGSRVRTDDIPVLRTGTYYELTAGANWSPNKHVAVRPELRWDVTGTPDLYPFGDETRSSQLLMACDVILRF